jgi:hypothetical protein
MAKLEFGYSAKIQEDLHISDISCLLSESRATVLRKPSSGISFSYGMLTGTRNSGRYSDGVPAVQL